MSHPDIRSDRPLYCCDDCETIGPVLAALSHERLTGHHARKLTSEEQRGVRETWHREDRCWSCGSSEHYQEGCPLS